MNYHRRLQHLEHLAAQLKAVPKSDHWLCKDMEGPEIQRLVEEAIDPDDGDLVEQIMAYVQEAAATPVLDFTGDSDRRPVFEDKSENVVQEAAARPIFNFIDDEDGGPALKESEEALVQEAEATPEWTTGKDGRPVLDENGEPVYEHHFFVAWLRGLQAGSWTLPKRLPRLFL